MTHPVGGTSPGASGIAIDFRLPGALGGRSFRDVLSEAAHSIDRGRRRLDRAARAGSRGRVLSHAELIALQSDVYRYTQELEIASKLVDKTASAVRTMLQSQQ